jgi:hypothetical protein
MAWPCAGREHIPAMPSPAFYRLPSCELEFEAGEFEWERTFGDEWGGGAFGAAGTDAFFFGDFPAGVFRDEDFDEAGFAVFAAAVFGAGEFAPEALFVGFGVGDAEPVLGVDLGAALGDEFLLGGAARDLRSAELAFEHDVQRVFSCRGAEVSDGKRGAVETVRVAVGGPVRQGVLRFD